MYYLSVYHRDDKNCLRQNAEVIFHLDESICSQHVGNTNRPKAIEQTYPERPHAGRCDHRDVYELEKSWTAVGRLYSRRQRLLRFGKFAVSKASMLERASFPLATKALPPVAPDKDQHSLRRICDHTGGEGRQICMLAWLPDLSLLRFFLAHTYRTLVFAIEIHVR